MLFRSVYSLDVPLLKNNNAVLAFDENDAVTPAETACIKCGRCVSHCPLRLMPVEIERAFKLKRGDMLEELKVNLCMECGCCSYICPARRPLVQTNKLAKLMLRDYQAEKKAAAERERAKAAAEQEQGNAPAAESGESADGKAVK